jgi:hypothetical protein
VRAAHIYDESERHARAGAPQHPEEPSATSQSSIWCKSGTSMMNVDENEHHAHTGAPPVTVLLATVLSIRNWLSINTARHPTAKAVWGIKRGLSHQVTTTTIASRLRIVRAVSVKYGITKCTRAELSMGLASGL